MLSMSILGALWKLFELNTKLKFGKLYISRLPCSRHTKHQYVATVERLLVLADELNPKVTEN